MLYFQKSTGSFVSVKCQIIGYLNLQYPQASKSENIKAIKSFMVFYFTHFLLAIAYQCSVNMANSKHSACKVTSMINFGQLYLRTQTMIPFKHKTHEPCNTDQVRSSPVKHDQYILDNLCNRDVQLDNSLGPHSTRFSPTLPSLFGGEGLTQEFSKFPSQKIV